MSESECEVCLGGPYGDYAELYTETIFKARKPAKCCECYGAINRGEQYEKVVMLYEGEWCTYRTCSQCREIRSVFSCGKGWMFESLWEDMTENVFPILTTATKCFQKLTPSARLFVLEKWQQWKGLQQA